MTKVKKLPQQYQIDQLGQSDEMAVLATKLDVLAKKGQIEAAMLVTAASAGQGKGNVAAGLAKAVAATGRTVALIDADPSDQVASHFGGTQTAGIRELITKAAKLADVLHPVDAKLAVIANGQAQGGFNQVAAGEQLDAVLTQLKSQFDLVIVNAPSVDDGADAMVLAEKIQATLFVMRMDVAKVPAVDAAIDKLQHVDAKFVGSVIVRK